mmetsp:Transcript_21210/g.36159  ORF Transcript_21210/g.36159 Transcript_21210/m.36159 type:complete len:252 (+) Transcript_21210:550-1305(+)
MFIPQTSCFKFRFIIFVINLLKNVHETTVVFLQNRVFRRQIQRIIQFHRILKASMCKSFNRFISIVHRQSNSCRFEIIHGCANLFTTVGWCENSLEFTSSIKNLICCFILVSMSMTSHHNRFRPSWHQFRHVFAKNRRTKYRTAQYVANSAVWTFPHFFQTKFFDTCFIWRNRGAFDCHAMFQRRVRRIDRDLIVGGVTTLQSQIKVIQFHINKRKNDLFTNTFPNNSCHFITIHFNNWIFNIDFSSKTSE